MLRDVIKVNRTKKSAKNALFALLSKIIYIVISFICRTFFIKYLSEEYLGVNGLFTNVLTILSFAELGIGNAIIFKLYKPIAENDEEKVKTLIHFYKKIYFLIGLFIFIVGLLIIPFLDVFIKNEPNIKESITFIYILFLFNTCVSYFFTYKKSIIIAYQNEYILSIIDLIISIVQNLLQIVVLIITKNFILYLIILIIGTIVNNVIASLIANKKYPFILEKKYKKIDKCESKSIFNDVKSLILYKFGYVLGNGTDNIIISSFIGVGPVGLLSNYTTLTAAITSVLGSFFNALTASVGNLNTIKDKKKKEDVFYQIIYISFIVYSVISVCVAVLSNRFVSIWIGEKYVLSMKICFAIGFNLYIDGVRFANYTFRNTLGLFTNGRIIPLISSISNVVLSILLVNKIGMFGVLIATGLTRLLILTWYDPYIIHKYAFESTSKKYFKNYFYYFCLVTIMYIISSKLNLLISYNGLFGFVISGVLLVCVNMLIAILSTCFKEEFKSTISRFKNLIKE